MSHEQAVQGLSEAFGTLFGALRSSGLSDSTVRQPSLLRGWTVGHVLSHLARNANSYERVIRAARQGQIVDQYPGGAAQRHEEIEAGSSRRLTELLDDLTESEAGLLEALNQLTAVDWRGQCRRWGNQPWPLSDIPFLRWREVSIHTTDLGFADLGFDAWSDLYVERELRRQLAALATRLPGRTVLEVSPTDKDWELMVIGPGDAPGPLVSVAATSREILTWLVDRATPRSSWPALLGWQGVP